ncbi:MAG: hypothetical protein MR536_06875 [Prevotella sp.]|nr:hypothetical protein [Prevotella sp.]MDY3852137.1 hypothetical protein [Prevotella sp.]
MEEWKFSRLSLFLLTNPFVVLIKNINFIPHSYSTHHLIAMFLHAN